MDVAPRSTLDDFFAAARLKKEDMVTTRDILKGMASVVLEARVDRTLRVGMVVETQESSEDLDCINQLAVYKVLHNATGSELLARALTAMGWSEAGLAQATMVQTLGAVLGNHDATVEMVYNRIPTRLAMLRGLVNLKPDWHLSPGKAEYTPTRQVYIRNTRIICDLDSVADKALFDAGLTLSGFQFKIKTLTVEVVDARISTEKVTLLADVSFSPPALDAVAVDLQMAINLSSTSDTKEAYFLFSEESSLDNVLGVLGKNDGTVALAGVKLPFFSTTEDADDTSRHAVDSLSLAPGSMGFVLSQYGRVETDVVLDRIFFNAELESWIDVLLLGLKSTTLQDPQIRVNIASPFDNDLRRVRVDVDFALELPSSYTVRTRLSAIPLVRKGDYEYRLDLWSIGESVPSIDSALSGVYVRHVSGGLVHENGKWRFGDWNAGVWLPKFELVPGAVSLVDVDILITNYGQIQVEAHGAVYLPSPLTTIYTRAGAVTLQNILTGLHLGTYDDLPIVGQVLLTELRSLSAVTSPSVAGKPLTLNAFFVRLYHPKITVGGLEFKDVEFMFDVRWVVGEDGKRVRQKQISLSAYKLGDGNLQASIVYDGGKDTLVAALLPVRPVTIGQMLSACLPAAFRGLGMIKSVVDTLQFRGSSIGFKTKDGLDINPPGLPPPVPPAQ
ncbi:hypothetical protein N658DRAFT_527578 [Parathielavia hyrcaniae]|uniref:Uncharacterized protein n=1 Tax=Parathielavia hyrcaniae TaxID=113614 RepID=A0AAN6PTD6_9PEZI|nr:hypothetical protein N658DRAFT_527578 [Parathielavia hyrcaniae]